MANLKYYDSGSSEWKSLVIGKQGPQGAAGAVGPQGPGVISSTNAPSNTTVIWYNIENGNAYLYYDGFWTSISGASGIPVPSATAPADTTVIWYNTNNGNAYLYYDGFWTSISGPSIPTGGSTGQVLAKTSATDYATQWVAPSGLEFIKSQTIGTAVSSVTVTGAFSATYDAYQILVSGGAASGNVAMRLRLGAAATGYNTMMLFNTWGSTGSPVTGGGNNLAYFNTLGFGTTSELYMNAQLVNPFATTKTQLISASEITSSGSSVVTGLHTVSTSFTDFTILTVSGTLTGGTVAVYGYRKA
jgi:hypothetical protein